VKVADWPAGTDAEAGLTSGVPGVALAPPVAVNAGATATPLAPASPAGAVLVTVTVNEIAWPTLTVAGGCVPMATLSPAGARTVAAFELTGPNESAAPVFAAVPLAVARNVRVPEAAAV
jgi:hypothetical protein